MKPQQKKQPLGSLFKSNFASGLVVFLVALPLCLGIALASGAPPLSGVLAGIVGGIVIGSLSTSHISVSGPAAGLAAIILAAITELGSFELFLCAGLIAGVIQLLLGFIRAGSLAEYIPVSVIEGMLAGIGVIIIMKQIPFALGSSGSLADPAARAENLELGEQVGRCLFLAVCGRNHGILRVPHVVFAGFLALGAIQRVVALDLHAAGEGQQGHDGGDEDGGRLAAAPCTHVAADRLGEE